LITFDLLAKVKPGATVVNTARKEIIDEPGLLRMMETRPDFLYASDIAPDCRDEMIKKYPGRCFFTLK
jgi:D-3-phosphoglycerate dehydrogenase